MVRLRPQDVPHCQWRVVPIALPDVQIAVAQIAHAALGPLQPRTKARHLDVAKRELADPVVEATRPMQGLPVVVIAESAALLRCGDDRPVVIDDRG